MDARGSIPDKMLNRSTKVSKFFQSGSNGLHVLKVCSSTCVVFCCVDVRINSKL